MSAFVMVKRAAMIGAVVCASVLIHFVFVGVIVLAEHWPLPTLQTNVMDVELVSAADIPKPQEKLQDLKIPDTTFAQTAQDKAQGKAPEKPKTPAPSAAQEKSQAPSASAPAPVNPAADNSLAPPTASETAVPGNLAAVSGGPPSDTKAKLTPEDIAALRAQINKCWTLPVGTPNISQLAVVIRVALGRDGFLLAEPDLLKAPASAQGPVLVGLAMQALRKCAPYRQISPEKYSEWQLLDLSFTATGMGGLDSGPKPGAKR